MRKNSDSVIHAQRSRYININIIFHGDSEIITTPRYQNTINYVIATRILYKCWRYYPSHSQLSEANSFLMKKRV